MVYLVDVSDTDENRAYLSVDKTLIFELSTLCCNKGIHGYID